MPTGEQHGGNQQTRYEEEQLGPHQGLNPARHAKKGDRDDRRRAEEPHHGQEDQGHEEHRRCFRHHDPAGHPEVGSHCRQPGRGQPDPWPGDGAAQQTHAQHDGSTQRRHRQERRRDPVETDDQADPTEEQGGHGRVGRRRGEAERRTEELPRDSVRSSCCSTRRRRRACRSHDGSPAGHSPRGRRARSRRCPPGSSAEAADPHRSADAGTGPGVDRGCRRVSGGCGANHHGTRGRHGRTGLFSCGRSGWRRGGSRPHARHVYTVTGIILRRAAPR